jgi:predicted RNase H-like HicB family nuclease
MRRPDSTHGVLDLACQLAYSWQHQNSAHPAWTGYNGVQPMAFKLTASVRAATRFDDATNVYVAYCPSLQLYSQGTDEKRARLAIESAVMLFLKNCINNGVLDEALKDRGFSSVSPENSKTPEQASRDFVAVEQYDQTFELDVPLYLLNQSEKDSHVC